MTYHSEEVELPFDFRPPLVAELVEGSGTYVRLSEDVRRSVVYLGFVSGAPGEIEPCGTGFVVTNGQPGGTYLVTAAHVVIDNGLDKDSFDIRMNQKPNPDRPDKTPLGRILPIHSAKWFFHPDRTVDVAVMPFEPPEWADVKPWEARHFATEFKKKTKDIGAGDFTYVVGILPYMRGKKRNMPAVHTGHIILMPDGEKVTIADWRQHKKRPNEATEFMEADVYLVQSIALKGASGSPVFVRRTLNTEIEDPRLDMNPIVAGIPGSLWFLGIWRSAWFGEAPAELNLPSDRVVPFGIGTVVPAPAINEILDQPELQEMRKAALLKSLEPYADEKTGAAIRLTAKSVRAGDDILRAAMKTAPLEKTKAKPAKRGRSGVSSK